MAQVALRLDAVDGANANADIAEWAASVVVENALDAVVYISYRRAPAPGVGNYDVVVPGSSLLVVPIPNDPNIRAISGTVDYPGAVPPGDVGLICKVTVTEVAHQPFVGPLA
jgi:hypothetical protein